MTESKNIGDTEINGDTDNNSDTETDTHTTWYINKLTKEKYTLC